MFPSLAWTQDTGDLLEEVVDYDSRGSLFHDHGSSSRADCLNCDAFRTRWELRAAVLTMDRITEDPRPLIQNTTNASQQINADDFDFDWQTGFDVSLLRRKWDDSAFELRFLDLGTLTANTSLQMAPSQIRIDASPPVFAPNVERIDADYDSEFYSIEANRYWPVYERVHLLAGFRYVSLDDQLRNRLDAGAQTFLYEDTTENDLYGGQLGFVTLPHQPFANDFAIANLGFSTFGKAGVYGNDGHHRSFVDTGATRLAINESEDDVAFLGEFGATARLQFGDWMAITGGYSLLWLEHVAIASDQTAVSDFFNQNGTDDRGSAIFHGATLAIELVR